MTKFLTTFAAALLLTACQSTQNLTDAEQDQVTAYTNAQIFNDDTFEPHALCVFEHSIMNYPQSLGTMVDLSGQFLTPPFGDARIQYTSF